MREADRPLELRVSVLDRERTESDALPEHLLAAPMTQEVDAASIRLALALDDCRIFVGLGTREESLFLCVADPHGAGAGIGPRATLVTHGARIQWHGNTTVGIGTTVGIVADLVTAVRVGDVEAELANNVFMANASPYDGIVVTTPHGERTVPRPRQPDPHRSRTVRLQGPFRPLV